MCCTSSSLQLHCVSQTGQVFCRCDEQSRRVKWSTSLALASQLTPHRGQQKETTVLGDAACRINQVMKISPFSSSFCFRTKLDSHLMFLTLAKASARLPADSLRLRGLRGLVEPERESCRGFHDRSASPIDDERCRTVGVAEAPPPPPPA